MRRLCNTPGIVFALFFVWKVGLFVFTAQPIPSNDSYFFDGAVVNLLHGGEFVNPTVAIARPYSGQEFFSPYPPLYQPVLYGWMSVFGTSAAAATGLHVLLVLVWAGLVYLILRQWESPAWAMHLAGGFLFVITFHDRPDGLAQVFGTAALLACVRWVRAPARPGPLCWSAVCLALTFGTGLQLGATYLCIVVTTVVVHAWLAREPLPWRFLLVVGLTPFVLLAVGRFGFPRWWIGFVENAQENPSNLGWHLPELASLLKLMRTLPGFFLMLLLFVGCLPRIRMEGKRGDIPQLALLVGVVTGMSGVCFLGLSYFTPNYIPAFAGYLQPIFVGAGLTWLARADLLPKRRAWLVGIACLSIGVGGIRAIGMTTWGVLCARDVSYQDSCKIVARELEAAAAARSKTVLLSSAYLYAAAGHTNLNVFHSDFVVRPRGAATERDIIGLVRLQPSRLVLTQFDYYRRYEPELAQFRRDRGDVGVRITNLARVQPPDAIPATRKIVQHISWAPVIIEFSWPESPEPQ
jgi:hypothetical protein